MHIFVNCNSRRKKHTSGSRRRCVLSLCFALGVVAIVAIVVAAVVVVEQEPVVLVDAMSNHCR
jgi:predicted methyltransferase